MKQMNYFALIMSIVLFYSCKKENPLDNNDDNQLIIQDMNQITAPKNFDWSASKGGNFNIEIQCPDNVNVNNQVLYLIDNKNNILSKTTIQNNKASFGVKVPNDMGDLFLFYPNTANKQKLKWNLASSKGGANTTMYVSPQPRIASKSQANKDLVYDRKLAQKIQSMQFKGNSKGVNLVANPYFDINNLGFDGRHWTYLRAPGKWYYTESNSTAVTTFENNNYVFKNTTNNFDVIEQSFPVQGGSTFNFSMVFSGNLNLWLDNFDASGNWIGETYVSTSGNHISSSGTILPNATHFQFYIGLYSGAWVDSIVYVSTDVVADSDGDGINDNADDYPTNANYAYDVYYPTIGYQTLSFEDLWPAKGDYDFNDIVVSNRSHFITNPDGDFVVADFEITLDACGSSLPSGLAINFLDMNLDSIGDDIILNVTGDAIKDPNVRNGVIVYTNHFDEQSSYYTNTSLNQNMGIPEEFDISITLNLPQSKTISFAANTYIADIYYFRSSDRGHEIHLPEKIPSTMANTSLFGTQHDNAGTPYKTETGLPWGIEVVTSNKTYKHPLEKTSITGAYLNFGQWANSGGQSYSTWYENAVANAIFLNQ
jgi:LruC domain-containing protein